MKSWSEVDIKLSTERTPIVEIGKIYYGFAPIEITRKHLLPRGWIWQVDSSGWLNARDLKNSRYYFVEFRNDRTVLYRKRTASVFTWIKSRLRLRPGRTYADEKRPIFLNLLGDRFESAID